MAASFRSHFRHTPRQDETHPVNQPAPHVISSTKAIPADNRSHRAVQHVSKLARRASRAITSSDKPQQSTVQPARGPISASATPNPPITATRAPVSTVQASETLHVVRAQPTHHRNGIVPPQILRTPSLVSGSSASTFDSPRPDAVRNKPSGLSDRNATQKRSNTAPMVMEREKMHSRNEGFQEVLDNSVLGTYLPPIHSTSTSAPRATSIENSGPQERHRLLARTPPVASYAPSLTPSTRYTSSPFSRAPTPSSASSYEPCVAIAGGPSPLQKTQSSTQGRYPTPRGSNEQAVPHRLGLAAVRGSPNTPSESTIRASQSVSALGWKETSRKAVPTSSSRKTHLSDHAQRDALTDTASSGRQALRTATPSLMRIPPELAHLNVDPPTRARIDKPLPPTRPSRDGTPDLAYAARPSPVIQSDLPRLYTTYHKRTASQETAESVASSTATSRFGPPSRASSKHASPRVDSAISPPPSRNFVRNATPELPPDGQPPETQALRRRDPPAIASAPSPSKSPRFGLFSRKSKAEVSRPAEQLQRQPSKGPAAGTGHEGYGRFGFRGRSGSTAGSSTKSNTGLRSPSTDSNTSSIPKLPTLRKGSRTSSTDASELDEFVRERLTPVILRGSGSTVVSTASSSEAHGGSAGASSSSSLPSECVPKTRLLPPGMSGDAGRTLIQRPSLKSRKTSDSSDDDFGSRYGDMAMRRSSSRLSRAAEPVARNGSTSIDVRLPVKSTPGDSYGARGLATSHGGVSSTRRAHQPTPIIAQSKSTRKWNFFQRAQASPRPKGKARAADVNDPSHINPHHLPHRSVAHYAMLDPVESVDLYEVERILQEAESSPDDSMCESKATTKALSNERRQASLLPPPLQPAISTRVGVTTRPTLPSITIPSVLPESSRAQAAVSARTTHVVLPKKQNWEPLATQISIAVTPQVTPELTQLPFDARLSNRSTKQPRLSPVGRIPNIVSRRDRERKLPDNSFSRPFVRTQPHPNVKPPGVLYNSIRELASPIEGGSQPVSSTSTRSESISAAGRKSSINTQPPSISTTVTSINHASAGDCTTFRSRKDSDTSLLSSAGTLNWPATQHMQPQMDDHWNEYNDLVDDMMPLRTPLSASSSLGAPFQYSSMLDENNSPLISTPLYSARPPPHGLPLPPLRSNTAPITLSLPRRASTLVRPLRLNSMTLSDIVEQYGSRSTGSRPTSNRTSLPPPIRSTTSKRDRNCAQHAPGSSTSSRHSRSSGHSRSASLPEVNARNSRASSTPSARFRRDAQLLDIGEHDALNDATRSDLRFGALMTSKWLSFGRVLFSPAHNEMRLADEPRVLVLDGLGSDWSYYVALTYPGTAVYNLSCSTTKDSTSWPGINQKAPSNHRRIAHSNIQASFPFPKGFFTAVVFRFPVATTDEAYQACVSECKRVLRPGGYLEVAIVDLDLINMGHEARKAVRGLKTRMQTYHQNVDLRNLGDSLVRLIGRRGFEDIQRCVVGVPTAGRIPSSRDISSIGSGDSAPRRLSERTDNAEIHLEPTDMPEDIRAMQVDACKTSDEGITKMAARVGRWWYSSCYESSLADRSIWDDRTLLQECEELGTTFRLLICHAQKPLQTRRRTVSV